MRSFVVSIGTVACALASAHAQPSDPPPDAAEHPQPTPINEPPPAPPDELPSPAPAPVALPTGSPEPAAPAESRPLLLSGGARIQFHGFVSEGGFVSTANDFIGASSRGSLEFFEAGLNATTEVTDRLRAGIQLFGRDAGAFRDIPPRIDWAYLDYHWRSYLGLRAGIIKMPYGLYNEYADIDAARTAILLPQAVYPLADRSALLAQTGFAAYGAAEVGKAGSLEYQAWLGTLNVPANALDVKGGTLDNIETKYVTGAQVFWRPIEELRVGGSFLRTSIDFDITLDAANTNALIMAGVVPPTYDGSLVISQRPDQFWLASAELTHEDWLFAAEYGRWYKRQRSSLPSVLPTFEEHNERFYAMATRRVDRLEVGAYYSVFNVDADDRGGHDQMKFAERFYAWSRDAALALRYDINDHWLWKLEGHVIDGTAGLFASTNPKPERFWGLFLFRTTVTF